MSFIVKGAARIASDGTVTQLGAKATPDEIVTADDVKDTAKLAKTLTRILSLLATLRRTWIPRSVTFDDVTVNSASSPVTLEHGLNGRVRWWVVDFSTVGTNSALLRRDTVNTTANTLVLLSQSSGVASIRVEEAG